MTWAAVEKSILVEHWVYWYKRGKVKLDKVHFTWIQMKILFTWMKIGNSLGNLSHKSKTNIISFNNIWHFNAIFYQNISQTIWKKYKREKSWRRFTFKMFLPRKILKLREFFGEKCKIYESFIKNNALKY